MFFGSAWQEHHAHLSRQWEIAKGKATQCFRCMKNIMIQRQLMQTFSFWRMWWNTICSKPPPPSWGPNGVFRHFQWIPDYSDWGAPGPEPMGLPSRRTCSNGASRLHWQGWLNVWKLNRWWKLMISSSWQRPQQWSWLMLRILSRYMLHVALLLGVALFPKKC